MSLFDIKKLCSFTSDSLDTVKNLSMLSLYVRGTTTGGTESGIRLLKIVSCSRCVSLISDVNIQHCVMTVTGLTNITRPILASPNLDTR